MRFICNEQNVCVHLKTKHTSQQEVQLLQIYKQCTTTHNFTQPWTITVCGTDVTVTPSAK